MEPNKKQEMTKERFFQLNREMYALLNQLDNEHDQVSFLAMFLKRIARRDKLKESDVIVFFMKAFADYMDNGPTSNN